MRLSPLKAGAWLGALAFLSALALARDGLAQATGGAGPLTADAVEAAGDAEMAYVLPVAALFPAWPGLEEASGLARVRVIVSAGARSVARVVRVQVDDLAYAGVALGRLELRLWTPAPGGQTRVDARLSGALGTATGTVTLAVDVDRRTGALIWGPGDLEAQVEARDVDLAWLARAWRGVPLGGMAQVRATLAGPAEHPRIEAAVQARDATWRGEPIGAVDLRFGLAEDRAEASLRLGDEAAPTATLSLSVPVAIDLRARTTRWLDREPHKLTLAAHALTAERLRPLWLAPGGVDFALDLDATAEGSLDAFDLSATLAGTLSSGGAPATPVSARFTCKPRQQSLSASLGEGLADLALEATADLVAVRRQSAGLAWAKLSGRLGLALPLPVVGPFLPTAIAAAQGTLTGSVGIGGSLGAPTLDGRIESRGASATLVPANRRLDALTLVASLAGDRLTLETLDASSAPGTLSGTGALQLIATPPGAAADASLWSAWRLEGAASLELRRFPVVQPDVPIGLLDATVEVGLKAGPGDVDLSVRVDRADVELTSERVPRASAIPSNAGIRRADGADGPGRRGAAQGTDRFAFSLELPRAMKLHGQGTELAVAGRLAMERRGLVVRVDGGLDVQPGGGVRLLGRDFDVRGGQLTLAEGHLGRAAEAGPADARPDAPPRALPGEPVLNLVLRGLVEGTHVLVKVQGPATRPVLVLVSVPALPEYQILTLLILGRIDVVDDRNGEVRREAAALVDRFHNPGLKRQLFDRLGVDKVGLGVGSSVSQPIVTVGKQVTRTLYVETTYRVNAPPDRNEREGRVDYQVSPHWATSTVFGDAGEGGIGVFWSTRFGGPPPPAPPPDTWGLRARKARGDRDGDGVLDPYDLCLAQPEDRDGHDDDDGCPDRDNDGDEVPDSADAAPLEPETRNGFEDDDGKPDTPPVALQGLAARLGGFAFQANSGQLPPEGQARLRAAAALLKMVPGVRVEVIGHSDDQGTQAGNRRVSLQRANTALAFLAASGVPLARITAVGRGFDQPLDPGTTEEARARNRRIELRFYED